MKKSNLLTIGLVILLCLGIILNFHPNPALAEIVTTKTLLGDRKPMGKGNVWTWLKVDKKTGIPVSLGVTLSAAGLEGLPEDNQSAPQDSLKLKLIDGSPYHTFESELMFPKEAEKTAYSHMGFNWNPEGHGPLPDVFFRPHFDVHF